jgi:acyl-CoA synthetase (AMP-forming)/AMP-acid ligase II
MDEQGYVRITGRIKDLIIRGGENIHPLEIENVLLAHPSVAEVSVVGLSDERYGETVAAFVVKRNEDLTTGRVREWVLERLSPHLMPKYFFWIKNEEIPKTASGKIQKFRLREMGIDMARDEKGL